MSEEIFRKKSLDKIKSPEDLNDYLRVSNPGVWMLLTAVIILLIGACVWGAFGHVDTEIRVPVTVEDAVVVCSAGGEDIETGMRAVIGSVEGTVAEALGEGRFLLAMDGKLPDGSYTAEVTVESVSPMSFITN